jgi:hypothetical protein
MRARLYRWRLGWVRDLTLAGCELVVPAVFWGREVAPWRAALLSIPAVGQHCGTCFRDSTLQGLFFRSPGPDNARVVVMYTRQLPVREIGCVLFCLALLLVHWTSGYRAHCTATPPCRVVLALSAFDWWRMVFATPLSRLNCYTSLTGPWPTLSRSLARRSASLLSGSRRVRSCTIIVQSSRAMEPISTMS